MIYIHVINQDGKEERNPADFQTRLSKWAYIQVS
jgi:hypothetical protein